MDLYGYGPIMKASGFSYLCYMFVFKNYKVPILYFILYGFGSLLAANHLSNIKNIDLDKKTDVFIDDYLHVN